MNESELRAMVRAVLSEALGRTNNAGVTRRDAPPAEQVALTTDGELAAFVRRIIAYMDDAKSAEALRSGKLRFTLARPGIVPAQARAVPSAHASSVELTGTITEAKISTLAGASTVHLAPDAVITPLARDRARALGLKIERRR